MSQLRSLALQHTALLQRYILAADHEAFLKQEVTLPQDSHFFSLLLDQPSDKDQQYMRNLSLSQSAKKQLKMAKLWRQARQTTTPEGKHKLLKELKQMHPEVRFDFPQPAQFTTALTEDQEKTEKVINNRLKTEETVRDVVLRAIKQNSNNFMKLSPYGLRNYPLDQMKDVKEMDFGYLIEKKDVVKALDPEQFAELLASFLKKAMENKNSSEEEEFPEELHQTLTTAQIQALKKRLPNLFKGYNYYKQQFRQKYQEKLRKFKTINELSFEEKEQKRKLCVSILNELTKENNEFAGYFIEKITEEVLLIQESIVDCSLDRFMRYVSELKSVNYENLEQNYRESIKQKYGKNKHINKYHEPLNYLDSSRVSQAELINKVILCLLKQGGDGIIAALEKYISRKHLMREDVKAKLSKGKQKDILNIYEMFTVEQVNAMKQQKKLTFADNNPNTYKIDQPVNLSLTIKNVKEVTIKIFAIDLEKQYLEAGGQINQQINLKFLVAMQERKEVYDIKDPFQERSVELKVPELDGRLGMFILELQAEGVTSRAVIRKGTIVTKNKVTLVGHELTFYNQKGQQIPELSIWRDNKRIDVNKSYTIPFGSQGVENITVCYNGYAQKERVAISQENYSFSADYLYHSESFIVGHKAKVVIRTQLNLGGEQVSLQRLGKTDIKVTMINNQNISHVTTVDDVKFVDGEDYVLELPIKSYISSVNIDIESEIEKIDKTKQKLRSRKDITIDLEENNDNFIDTYLQQNSKGEYTLQVKGKNGEAIPKIGATFSYQQFGANFSFSQNLNADNNGLFLLGNLKQVKKLMVSVTSNGFTSVRNWAINNYSESVSYGGNIFNNSFNLYLKQGQGFNFPLPCKLTNEDVIFYHEHPLLSTVTNCASELKLTDKEVRAEGLKLGHYVLILLRLERRIDVEVVKGKKWIDGDLIDDENTIYKVRKQKQYLMLGDLKAQKTQDKNYKCSLEILGLPEKKLKNMRLHIFAKNFIDPENPGFYICSDVKKIPNERDHLKIKGSSYYSDKRLSDQTAYVLNRRKQDITAGNNLEKPHVFLKRTEVRSTDTKDEILQAEGRFMKKQMHPQMRECAMMSRCAAPAPQGMAYSNCFDEYSGGGGMRGFSGGKRAVTLQRKFNAHNNFLSTVGHLTSNISESKEFIVPQGYTQLVVYLFTNNTSIKREYALPQDGQVQLINLTHSLLKDQSDKEGWTMSREIYQVYASKEKQISRGCSWTTVSKSTVIEYANTKGITLPSWLSSWSTYSREKKLEVYNDQFCHELNFFIYRNDPEFFKTVVRPFLSNRIRKTFLDLYLVDDKGVMEYASPHRLEKLNDFEKALLVDKLRESGNSKEADSVASTMELSLKNLKQTGEQFKSFFETILNAKKSDSGPIPPPPPPASSAFGGCLFGGAPVPQMNSYAMRAMSQEDMCFATKECALMERECCEYDEQCDEGYYGQSKKQAFGKAQKAYKPGFKETEKTKQYTDTTYSGVTDVNEIPTLIQPSLFWAELARHYSTPDAAKDFLSDKFWSFHSKRQFILACSVLPTSLQAEYELSSTESSYKISAKTSFLIFAREVKALPYSSTKNIVLNQRFYDPADQFYFEDDGTKCEKIVENFLVLRPYTLQTIITNISSSALEVQLLMDIPEGSIPLRSHEQTQILNVSIPAYNTKTFEREFYFPSEGKYHVYPANVSRNKIIISKGAQLPILPVGTTEPISKKQSLTNILRSGSNSQVYNYLQTKNIFDENLFNWRQILWKLKDKEFYTEAIKIFRGRNYYQPVVWSFSLLHDDYSTAMEFFEQSQRDSTLGVKKMDLPIFEYYPYYSSRVHKFADEGKSTIRVKEFRQNYSNFLLSVIFEGQFKRPEVQLALVYYLILQDRIKQARQVHQRTPKQIQQQYKLQSDYIDCFLDMYEGSQSNYATARKISEQYRQYPVPAWRKLFLDVYEALNKSEQLDTEDSAKSEEVVFNTTVTNNGEQIKINRPGEAKVIVNFYKIDIELYFSEFPFQQVGVFSSVNATRSETFTGKNFAVHVLKKADFAQLGDSVVEVYQYRQNAQPKRVDRFLWSNPAVKVKVNETEGTLKVFHEGKKCSTSYVKVYSRGSKGEKFYRDGYTDIASSFRYALDQKDINEFAILVMTDHGGVVRKVKPPAIS